MPTPFAIAVGFTSGVGASLLVVLLARVLS